MRRIKMCLAYDGTNYAGWQVQAGQGRVETVQGTVEKALALITKEEGIRVVGAGRTDAGVHARGQVIHFDTQSRIPINRFPAALNSVLPPDIRFYEAEEVSGDFHAQYWAKEKTYRYTLDRSPVPDVFLRNYACHVPYELDVATMKEAAQYLIGTHDFRSFCAAGSSVKTFVRTIKEIHLSETGSLIYVNITADGFLYNMIRIIVGTLLEIGRGKMSPGYITKLIAARDRSLAGPTAPAKGLCLENVVY
jgi:tRNA pseudouridine38-40 synthase